MPPIRRRMFSGWKLVLHHYKWERLLFPVYDLVVDAREIVKTRIPYDQNGRHVAQI